MDMVKVFVFNEEAMMSVFPQVALGEHYDALMKTAQDAYKKSYERLHQKFVRESERIYSLLADWRKSINEQSKTELWVDLDRKIDILKQYLCLQKECGRVLKIFNEVIAKCAASTLDRSTLMVMQRLGIDTADLQRKCERFQVDLEALTSQREEIAALYKEATQVVSDLKLALEPLAHRRGGGFGWVALVNYAAGRTPYVDSLIEQFE